VSTHLSCAVEKPTKSAADVSASGQKHKSRQDLKPTETPPAGVNLNRHTTPQNSKPEPHLGASDSDR